MKYNFQLSTFNFLPALLLSCSAPAQNLCLDQVKACYAKYARMGEQSPAGENVWHLDYTVRTAVKKDNGETQVSASGIKIWMQGNRLEAVSDQMEVYQDGRDIFTVIPSRKTIYRTDPWQNINSAERRKYLAFVQDTIFSFAEAAACNAVNDGTGADREVVLRLSAQGRKLFHIGKVTFRIRSAAQELVRVKIEYTQDRPAGPLAAVQWVEYTFNNLSLDCRDRRPAKAPASRFVRAGNKPAEAYSGYRIVDNRRREVKKQEAAAVGSRQ